MVNQLQGMGTFKERLMMGGRQSAQEAYVYRESAFPALLAPTSAHTKDKVTQFVQKVPDAPVSYTLQQYVVCRESAFPALPDRTKAQIKDKVTQFVQSVPDALISKNQPLPVVAAIQEKHERPQLQLLRRPQQQLPVQEAEQPQLQFLRRPQQQPRDQEAERPQQQSRVQEAERQRQQRPQQQPQWQVQEDERQQQQERPLQQKRQHDDHQQQMSDHGHQSERLLFSYSPSRPEAHTQQRHKQPRRQHVDDQHHDQQQQCLMLDNEHQSERSLDVFYSPPNSKQQHAYGDDHQQQISMLDVGHQSTERSLYCHSPRPPTVHTRRQTVMADGYLGPDGTRTCTPIDVTVTSDVEVVDAWLGRQPFGSVFGLDVEWKPNDCTNKLKGEENPVALLQISTASECLLVQMLYLAKDGTRRTPPSKALIEFLADPDKRLTGVGVSDDCKKLKSHYDLESAGKVELSHIVSAVRRMPLAVAERFGLKRLAKLVLDWDMPKEKAVTMSDWSKPELSLEQVEYACLDAWASLTIYQALDQEFSKQAFWRPGHPLP